MRHKHYLFAKLVHNGIDLAQNMHKSSSCSDFISENRARRLTTFCPSHSGSGR